MSTPTSESGLPSTAIPSRASQTALGVLSILAMMGLLYRGYGDQFGGKPTILEPAAVRYAVNLNTADRAELMQVPGVGPNLADAILSHRHEHGRFSTVEELSSVKGVGRVTLETVRPWVRVLEPESGSLEPVPELVKLERRAQSIPAPYVEMKPLKIRTGEPPIDIATADATEFQRLPGIGPVLAQRIVETRGRERFQSIGDLRRVKGIGVKTMNNLRPYVVCGTTVHLATTER